jgi:hypothetical protein
VLPCSFCGIQGANIVYATNARFRMRLVGVAVTPVGNGSNFLVGAGRFGPLRVHSTPGRRRVVLEGNRARVPTSL